MNFDFGVYAGIVVDGYIIPKKSTYLKAKSICQIQLEPGDAFVSILIQGSPILNLAYQATDKCLIVDTVNVTAPTSNSDLYDKLTTLIT